jgi:glycerophosphoryl diester phosphodiesterase
MRVNWGGASVWRDSFLNLSRWQVHRGYWRGGAVENSLAAFVAAFDHDAAMVECDVRLSRDQVPVLWHDISLERTAAATRLRVRETDWVDLERQGLCRLEDALTTCASLRFNIEIKWDEHDHGPVVERVAQVIARTKSAARVLISSFHPVCVWHVRRRMPDVPVALLLRDLQWLWQWGMLRLVGAHLVHLPIQLVTPERVRLLQRQGFKISVWTVNDFNLSQQLLSWGVDSIISDELPPAALE